MLLAGLVSVYKPWEAFSADEVLLSLRVVLQ